uniref:Mitochondrial import inner membrane translocase subunit TIM22 n=1 Tax=Heterorhabditis bacteriophora TaxID=37862 RepID=A0A1I7W7L7_HETBA
MSRIFDGKMWFGWGSNSSSDDDASRSSVENSTMDFNGESSTLGMSGFGGSQYEYHLCCFEEQSQPVENPFAAPVLALDQIKSAGVPVARQMTPYLQMDPSIFMSSQPQYIMPDGGASGKGKFEFALGHIGWAVGGGFVAGCVRGAFSELLNPETRKLTGKPWMTRMVNATVKHGSGFAQPAVRADDELNGLGAGALTGALYRSPHGLKASGIGAAVGVALAAAWTISSPDSRQRIFEIFA